jgi:hypothetical protein
MKLEKLPMYLNYDQFRENFVNWSDDTIRRRIADGFPAVQEGNGRYLLGPLDDIHNYFKRRKVRAG